MLDKRHAHFLARFNVNKHTKRGKRLRPNLADVITIEVKRGQSIATFPAILTFFLIACTFWMVKARKRILHGLGGRLVALGILLPCTGPRVGQTSHPPHPCKILFIFKVRLLNWWLILWPNPCQMCRAFNTLIVMTFIWNLNSSSRRGYSFDPYGFTNMCYQKMRKTSNKNLIWHWWAEKFMF